MPLFFFPPLQKSLVLSFVIRGKNGNKCCHPIIIPDTIVDTLLKINTFANRRLSQPLAPASNLLLNYISSDAK